ncbi:uncharacterized protein LOC128986823 isoform X2 [Macrosteles quadrilineatus]|nr:uncharacterized protein LOC128986823 isoform X2 [Macrosteles quadrilineatus]
MSQSNWTHMPPGDMSYSPAYQPTEATIYNNDYPQYMSGNIPTPEMMGGTGTPQQAGYVPYPQMYVPRPVFMDTQQMWHANTMMQQQQQPQPLGLPSEPQPSRKFQFNSKDAVSICSKCGHRNALWESELNNRDGTIEVLTKENQCLKIKIADLIREIDTFKSRLEPTAELRTTETQDNVNILLQPPMEEVDKIPEVLVPESDEGLKSSPKKLSPNAAEFSPITTAMAAIDVPVVSAKGVSEEDTETPAKVTEVEASTQVEEDIFEETSSVPETETKHLESLNESKPNHKSENWSDEMDREKEATKAEEAISDVNKEWDEQAQTTQDQPQTWRNEEPPPMNTDHWKQQRYNKQRLNNRGRFNRNSQQPLGYGRGQRQHFDQETHSNFRSPNHYRNDSFRHPNENSRHQSHDYRAMPSNNYRPQFSSERMKSTPQNYQNTQNRGPRCEENRDNRGSQSEENRDNRGPRCEENRDNRGSRCEENRDNRGPRCEETRSNRRENRSNRFSEKTDCNEQVNCSETYPLRHDDGPNKDKDNIKILSKDQTNRDTGMSRGQNAWVGRSENLFKEEKPRSSETVKNQQVQGTIKQNIVKQIPGDLFSAPHDFALAHCVAQDFRMGSGIAVKFKNEFKRVGELLDQNVSVGGCAHLDVDGRFIFYLVTKEFSIGKPRYEDLHSSLIALKEKCLQFRVKKLAMPRIGCGLDRLDWSRVKTDINQVFYNTDIEIQIYDFNVSPHYYKRKNWDNKQFISHFENRSKTIRTLPEHNSSHHSGLFTIKRECDQSTILVKEEIMSDAESHETISGYDPLNVMCSRVKNEYEPKHELYPVDKNKAYTEELKLKKVKPKSEYESDSDLELNFKNKKIKQRYTKRRKTCSYEDNLERATKQEKEDAFKSDSWRDNPIKTNRPKHGARKINQSRKEKLKVRDDENEKKELSTENVNIKTEDQKPDLEYYGADQEKSYLVKSKKKKKSKCQPDKDEDGKSQIHSGKAEIKKEDQAFELEEHSDEQTKKYPDVSKKQKKRYRQKSDDSDDDEKTKEHRLTKRIHKLEKSKSKSKEKYLVTTIKFESDSDEDTQTKKSRIMMERAESESESYDTKRKRSKKSKKSKKKTKPKSVTTNVKQGYKYSRNKTKKDNIDSGSDEGNIVKPQNREGSSDYYVDNIETAVKDQPTLECHQNVGHQQWNVTRINFHKSSISSKHDRE